jgi:hypothetical protein
MSNNLKDVTMNNQQVIFQLMYGALPGGLLWGSGIEIIYPRDYM